MKTLTNTARRPRSETDAASLENRTTDRLLDYCESTNGRINARHTVGRLRISHPNILILKADAASLENRTTDRLLSLSKCVRILQIHNRINMIKRIQL